MYIDTDTVKYADNMNDDTHNIDNMNDNANADHAASTGAGMGGAHTKSTRDSDEQEHVRYL